MDINDDGVIEKEEFNDQIVKYFKIEGLDRQTILNKFDFDNYDFSPENNQITQEELTSKNFSEDLRKDRPEYPSTAFSKTKNIFVERDDVCFKRYVQT